MLMPLLWGKCGWVVSIDNSYDQVTRATTGYDALTQSAAAASAQLENKSTSGPKPFG